MSVSPFTSRLPVAVLCAALLGACDEPTPVDPNAAPKLVSLTRRSMALDLNASETITFRAEDASGRAMSGLPVKLTADNSATIAAPGGPAASTVTVTTGSDGVATATLTVRNVDDPTTVTATTPTVAQALTYVFTGKCPTRPLGTIDDFCGQASTDWAGYNGLSVALAHGALLVTGNGAGGSGQYPVAVKNVGAVDFSATQKVTARIRVAPSSSGPAYVQLALNDVNGVGANKFGSVAGGLMFVVPNDGTWRTYTFDFTSRWVQWNDVQVDRAKIKELVFLVNPNTNPPFTGAVEIDDIARVP